MRLRLGKINPVLPTTSAGVLATFIAFAVACLVASFGSEVERELSRRDRARYQQIGTSIDIGGRKLNLFCSGTGTPPVILETFSHMAGFSWTGV
jgi:hypothetical protein